MGKLSLILRTFGRGGGIRTPDPLLPKQMRYQTALRPDNAPRWDERECSCEHLLIVSRTPLAVALKMVWIVYQPCQAAIPCMIWRAIQRTRKTGAAKIAEMVAARASRKSQSRPVWRCGSAMERVRRL